MRNWTSFYPNSPDIRKLLTMSVHPSTSGPGAALVTSEASLSSPRSKKLSAAIPTNGPRRGCHDLRFDPREKVCVALSSIMLIDYRSAPLASDFQRLPRGRAMHATRTRESNSIYLVLAAPPF